jgi:hypothetical protein
MQQKLGLLFVTQCVHFHDMFQLLLVWYADVLHFYGLFNNTISSSDYTWSGGMLINKWWIGKDVEDSDCPVWRNYPDISLEVLRKIMKTLSQVAAKMWATEYSQL